MNSLRNRIRHFFSVSLIRMRHTHLLQPNRQSCRKGGETTISSIIFFHNFEPDRYAYLNFDYENAVFEWDDAKEQFNFQKHGIHFKTAAKIFKDPDKLIRKDDEHPGERYDILGKVGKVLFVVCIFKGNHKVRIISARAASLPERRRYEYGEDFNEEFIRRFDR